LDNIIVAWNAPVYAAGISGNQKGIEIPFLFYTTRITKAHFKMLILKRSFVVTTNDKKRVL
jgi:hypothetical protein